MLFLFAWWGLTQAWATSFIQQPFPDTVQQAPLIARGKVGMSYADWAVLRDGSRRIHTFYELLIDEVVKGNPPNGKTLIMRQLGGEKDGVGMQVPGTAQFNRGEDVVVMLSAPNPDGSYDVMGMMMGKYVVKQNRKGEDYLVGPGLNPEGDGDGHVVGEAENPEPNKPPEQWTLAMVRTLVRSQTPQAVPANASAKAAPGGLVGADRLHKASGAPSSPAPAHSAESVAGPEAGESQTPARSTTRWIWGFGLALGLIFFVRSLARKR